MQSNGGQQTSLATLLESVAACTLCAGHLPNPPRPVLRAAATARLLIIGQAPGTRVHATGIPWNDPSGKRLRQWLNLSEADFYDRSKVAIVPMGFCYPGKGKGGDLPPRPECAPAWHEQLLALLPRLRCTLLIGHYAQRYYLPEVRGTVTERVQQWRDHAPEKFLLPHPSPRNHGWLQRNPWFEKDVVPELQRHIKLLLAD